MQETKRFAELVARPSFPLDEAAALIAVHADPDRTTAGPLAALDRLAEGCPEPTLHGVVRELFGRQGFRGNTEKYYDPRNSLLHDVLERRRGIPIALSVVTIEVGRRLGVPLHGVGMPGHFLVGDRVQPDVYVDAFGGGVILGREEARRLFASINGDQPFDADFLAPTPPLAIVRRMLANLAAIYSATGDRRELRWVLELVCGLPDARSVELAELAAVLAWCGRLDEAAQRYDEAAALAGGQQAEEYEQRGRRLRASVN